MGVLLTSSGDRLAGGEATLDKVQPARRDVRLVQSFHRTIAAMLLLGWLFATGHMLADHGGMMVHLPHHEDVGSQYDCDHDDAPADELHQHDLTAIAKQSPTQIAAPVWVSLYDTLLERLAMMRRENVPSKSIIGLEASPPDERSSGWLLVCQTALPVRGPSLVA